MKKLLVLLTTALLLVGCTNTPATPTPTPEASVDPVVETAYKVGVGSVTGLSPKAATADAEGSIQANTTYAAVVLDADGKIVYVSIDTAQNSVKFDAAGELTVVPEKTPTKKEKGADYNMVGSSEIGKEWFEQIAALEAWMIGKTIDEIAAMPTYQRDESHPEVPDVEDLKSSVTISVGDYLKAVQAAAANAVEVEGVAKVGVGSVTGISPKAATADAEGSSQFNTTYAVVALDADGNIAYVAIDTAQNSVKFDAAGELTVVPEKTPSKKEKGADYNMVGSSEIGKEWFEQIAALEAWMVGKTVADVTAMPTFQRDESHPEVPDVEDLKSSVTISVGDYLAAVTAANAAAVSVVAAAE